MKREVLDNWLVVTPGQCLLCGGRGGYPGGTTGTALCVRCSGTGRDPSRGENWFIEFVLPVQIDAARTNPDADPPPTPQRPDRPTEES